MKIFYFKKNDYFLTKMIFFYGKWEKGYIIHPQGGSILFFYLFCLYYIYGTYCDFFNKNHFVVIKEAK